MRGGGGDGEDREPGARSLVIPFRPTCNCVCDQDTFCHPVSCALNTASNLKSMYRNQSFRSSRPSLAAPALCFKGGCWGDLSLEM